MKQHLRIAILMTLVTTLLFGIAYPLVVTGLGQLIFPKQANGSMILHNGEIIGRGHNRRVQRGSAILHGEMDALENAGRRSEIC